MGFCSEKLPFIKVLTLTSCVTLDKIMNPNENSSNYLSVTIGILGDKVCKVLGTGHLSAAVILPRNEEAETEGRSVWLVYGPQCRVAGIKLKTDKRLKKEEEEDCVLFLQVRNTTDGFRAGKEDAGLYLSKYQSLYLRHKEL